MRIWKGHLRDNYANLQEFERYDEIFSLAERLDYYCAYDAWQANPIVQIGTSPKSFSVVKGKVTK